MSEKTRRKKDGEDKNKNERRMREVNSDLERDTPDRERGREGTVKQRHGIDSVKEGFIDDQNRA